MTESITPSGTTRTAFSIATNDLEINGDVTASKFIGSGERITNINVDSINRGNALSKLYGGTNNNIYIHQGIVFNNNSLINSENKLTTSSRLRWDNQANILYINGNDVVLDSSNYVKNTSNILSNNLKTTSNIILSDIFKHIENTLGIDNTNGIPIASTNKAGIVKVGEGLFMSSDGFLSILPEVVTIPAPSIIPNVDIESLNQSVVKSIYKKIIFTYNPNLVTTFDNNPDTNSIDTILPFWYNFNSLQDDIYISNKGNYSLYNITDINEANLILRGNAKIYPINNIDLYFEYTPLNNKYIYLDGTENTYVQIPDICNLRELFKISNVGGNTEGITFSFWFKISEAINNKSLLFFGSQDKAYYINIGISDNNISINIFNFGSNEYIITQYDNLFDNTWKHFCWSIDGDGNWEVYINGIKEPDILVKMIIGEKAIYKDNFIGRSRYDTDNTLNFSIADFRIYNKVLSYSQVDELYNANNYSKYILTLYDNNNGTNCDLIIIGGGGGGSVGGGGGAGKLIFIDNALLYANNYTIKVGRGGAGYYTTQSNSIGNDSTFGTIIAKGGG